MKKATGSVIKLRLISLLTRSTISVVAKLTTLATQKNIPLIITLGMPDFSISMKAKETKALYPALSIMIKKINKLRFCKTGIYFESWIKKAATNPAKFRAFMILRLLSLNLFLIKVPRLPKIAVDKLATSPSTAMSVEVSP